MHKLFIQFIFIFLGLTANAQNLIYRAPTNRNEIIDVREVADPTLNTKNFVPKSNDAITEINNLPYTPISTRAAFSVNNYPILGFTPKTNFTGSFSLNGLASIKFIDARFDNEKVGFSPVKNTLQKKGYNILGLQITKDPVDWLRENILQKGTINDTTANRVLTIVLQKFWFSNSANDRYTAANPRLVTTLHYHFDIYTSQGIGYYPQKKSLEN